MTNMIIRFSLLMMLSVLSASIFASNLEAIESNNLNVEIKVPRYPSAVPTIQGNILVYELHIINKQEQIHHIGLIEIMDESGKLITAYSGEKLQHNSFVYQGGERVNIKEIELKKGMGAFVTIWLSESMFDKFPKNLHHKIYTDVVFPDKGETRTTLLEHKVNVVNEKPVVLGYPLKGANWVASAGPSPDSYHRRAILPIDNQFYLAQRYAIDWMQVCSDGKAVHGDYKENENWNGFGDEIYAVVDGVVLKTHDDVNENTPPQLPVPQVGKEDISGNYVLLGIVQNKKNYYVLSAHMQPGSIRVKEGDVVKKGQVIGLLGNTGNSSAPHLHMHVCERSFLLTEGKNPLKCEGAPFVFEEVPLEGNVEDIYIDYGVWTPVRHSKNKSLKNMMPLNNQVFSFTKDQPKKCAIK